MKMEKKCFTCGEIKNRYEEFDQKLGMRDGFYNQCKKCRNEDARVRYTKMQGRKTNLRFFYNLTINSWNAMFEAQGKVCAICKLENKSRKGWHTDHDHKTNKVRGILCQPCNLTLGHLERRYALYKQQFDAYLTQ